MHTKDILEHLMYSYFIDVERDENRELVSFRLQTEYIRVGSFINQK